MTRVLLVNFFEFFWGWAGDRGVEIELSVEALYSTIFDLSICKSSFSPHLQQN